MMPTTGKPPGARCGEVTRRGYRPATRRAVGGSGVERAGTARLGSPGAPQRPRRPAARRHRRPLPRDDQVRRRRRRRLRRRPRPVQHPAGHGARGLRHGHLSRAVIATIISAAVATCVAWIGNRAWTFRHRRNRPVHHEALLFALTNGVALLIQAGCVGLSPTTSSARRRLVAENVAKHRRHRRSARCSGSGPTASSSSPASRSSTPHRWPRPALSTDGEPRRR